MTKGAIDRDESGRLRLSVDVRDIRPGDVLHYEIGSDGPRMWVGPPIPMKRIQPDVSARVAW